LIDRRLRQMEGRSVTFRAAVRVGRDRAGPGVMDLAVEFVPAEKMLASSMLW
jgi:hypothetical protein